MKVRSLRNGRWIIPVLMLLVLDGSRSSPLAAVLIAPMSVLYVLADAGLGGIGNTFVALGFYLLMRMLASWSH